MQHVPARLSRALILTLLGLFAVLYVVPIMGAELTDEERQYDPDIEAQTGKTGKYKLQIKAVPQRLFLQCVAIMGGLQDTRAAQKLVQEQPWRMPGGNEGGMPMPKAFSYQVDVPKVLDPSQPPGVFVFIHSSQKGDVGENIAKAVREQNMILISANEAGNPTFAPARITMAAYAVELLKRRYSIDENRVYVSGSSGGGRACCWAMFHFADRFTGGLPMMGTTPLYNTNLGGNKIMPGMPNLPSRDLLKHAAQNNRYVYLTGEKDYNRDECEAAPKVLAEKGFQMVKAIVVPGVGHGIGGLKTEDVVPALQFLDAPLVIAAIKLFDDAQGDHERGRLYEALTAYEKCVPYLMLGDDNTRAKAAQAKTKIQALNAQYDASIKALEKAIADQDARAAVEALRDLQRMWRDKLGRDAANEYRKQIGEIQRQ